MDLILCFTLVNIAQKSSRKNLRHTNLLLCSNKHKTTYFILSFLLVSPHQSYKTFFMLLYCTGYFFLLALRNVILMMACIIDQNYPTEHGNTGNYQAVYYILYNNIGCYRDYLKLIIALMFSSFFIGLIVCLIVPK